MYRILLLITLLSSSLAFSAKIQCPENQCVAVVNAGNTGSRLHIYSYEKDASNNPINIKKIFSKKIEPGIASVELNQKALNEYLSALFSDESDTPIPVYFYATSGMRMLSFAKQQAYFAKLTYWFSRHPQWQLLAAKTLKSKEEALYGWLAVNYELGSLQASTKPLVGVIDSGSAAAQIAFPIQDEQSISSGDYVHVNIYGREISLFTHGFLGLGQDEIRSQYLDHGTCFPRHYPLPNGISAIGNFAACTKLVKPLVNDIHQVNTTVQAIMQKNPNQTWYLIGGISAMLQEKPFTFEHEQFTGQTLAEKANRQVCQQDWAVFGTLYPENRHMFKSCLNASYFYSLITDGIGIQTNQPIRYISNKVSTNDWTLGVVLLQDKI